MKVVPDIEMVIPSDWTRVNNLRNLDIGYVNNIINTYDQSALELALRLRERTPNQEELFEVCVLSFGVNTCKPLLKAMFALRVDRAILIEDGHKFSNGPAAIAAVLEQAIRLLGHFDIILFGMQASEFDNGQVGLMTAERLQLPCITHVNDAEIREDQAVITHQTDVGMEFLQIDMPAVLIVGNTNGVSLRLPTLKDRIGASKHNLELLSLEKLGLQRRGLQKLDKRRIINMHPQLNQRKCEIIAGSTQQEKAAILFDRIKGILKN